MQTMKATVFRSANRIAVEEVPRPTAGVGEAVLRITLTTICGTDLHILRGEYVVKPGLVIGHEPVGVIEELGEGLRPGGTLSSLGGGTDVAIEALGLQEKMWQKNIRFDYVGKISMP